MLCVWFKVSLLPVICIADDDESTLPRRWPYNLDALSPLNCEESSDHACSTVRFHIAFSLHLFPSRVNQMPWLCDAFGNRAFRARSSSFGSATSLFSYLSLADSRCKDWRLICVSVRIWHLFKFITYIRVDGRIVALPLHSRTLSCEVGPNIRY